MRRRLPCLLLPALALLGAAAAASAPRSPAPGGRPAPPPGEWRAYGADPWGTRYSPLDQIGAENFRRLRVAWKWDSVDNAVLRQRPDLRPGPNEATPLMVEGILYTSTSLNQVAAIDAATGETRWVYNPGSYGGVHRGVAYWEGARRGGGGRDRRILIGTADSYLIALDAGTGKPVRSFGKNGRVDLAAGLRRPVNRRLVSVTSPPCVVGDVVVVGGAVDDFQDRREMPPGDVRGFDVRSGRRLWTFHTVPQEGELGNETWEDGSWRYTGNTNVWTVMSADPELGYVYLPVSTPTNDWYGGHRKGDNLFGESLVCLDAKTGRRVWHYQLVHHGLWDYDLPCAPNLIDVTVDGRRVKAVAQVTKQAFCFVFDRVTGKPLWPIEERPVPPSGVPGERASPTQPFPTRPAPFDRQGVTPDDLIDYTPELRREAEALLKEWVHGPLYTPPATRKTILMPGWVGGASWAGASADPETGYLYVPSITNPMWLALEKPLHFLADVDYKIGANGFRIDGPRGLPLFKGPYGRITAIDLNRGEHVWMRPQGEGPRNHPDLRHLNLPPQGIYHRTYTLVTKSLVLATQEGGWFGQTEATTEPPRLRAFDKATGRPVGEIPLPAHPTGAPITCMAGGRQLVIIPVGGTNRAAELIAVALPRTP